MSSASAMDSCSIAPAPSMDVHMEGSTPVNLKRGREDDIQFVSSKPVKKFRPSKESPPSQAQQAPGPVNKTPSVPTSGAPSTTNCPSASSPGVGLGISAPQSDSSMFYRGTSLPSMENYVFPQPSSGTASRTSRSSPMLSPKQLPPSSFPNLFTIQSPSITPTTAPDLGDPMQQRNFVTQWDVTGVPLQHVAMRPEVAPNPPMLFPHTQKLGTDLSGAAHDREQPSPSRVGTPRDVRPTSGPGTQPMEMHVEKAQIDRPRSPHKTPEPLRATQGFMAQTNWPAQPTAQLQARPMTHEQPQSQGQDEASGSNNYVVSGTQPIAPKPPCLACEQMRQQTFLNKTNGYQGVNYPHIHHGWHTSGVPHSHPTHMPTSSPGLAIGLNMYQNQKNRFEQVPQGQISTKYAFPQVPGQITGQLTMQRGVPMANMTTGSELFQDGTRLAPGHYNAMGNAGPIGPIAPQVAHDQYVQSHPSPTRPPAPAPKSMAAQTLPPSPQTPRMPTPPPSQKHSPNLIVDIAETCEELFPWDQVADRHNVPRQKVVETFAAIVQLPLLRCTTDKKRHGRLATNRLKDFTRAKNAAKIACPSSAASPPAAQHQHQPEPTSTEDRPILPGVLELANSMSPLGLPSSLINRFPGPR